MPESHGSLKLAPCWREPISYYHITGLTSGDEGENFIGDRQALFLEEELHRNVS